MNMTLPQVKESKANLTQFPAHWAGRGAGGSPILRRRLSGAEPPLYRNYSCYLRRTVGLLTGEGRTMVSQNDEHIQQLLREARSGSRASAGHLAVIVRQRLYPFVLRTLLDADAAEDILQDTLLAVLVQLDRLRENRKFWPWVYRIALSKIRDHIRRRRLSSAGKSTLALDRGRDEQRQNASVLEAQIHQERLRQVSDGIDQLSGEHRDIIRLRYYEQLSYAQIASRTRVSPKIARARSYRAKKRLKACLI